MYEGSIHSVLNFTLIHLSYSLCPYTFCDEVERKGMNQGLEQNRSIHSCKVSSNTHLTGVLFDSWVNYKFNQDSQL